VSNLHTNAVDVSSEWISVNKSDFVLFVNINDSSHLSVVASFKVLIDMLSSQFIYRLF
jgi:hypothetical protein